MVQILGEGCMIPFQDTSMLSQNLREWNSFIGSPKCSNTLQKEIGKIITSRPIEEIKDVSSGLYSCLFLIEWAAGGWKSVIILSPQNPFLLSSQFKMEVTAFVLLPIREEDWMASVDLGMFTSWFLSTDCLGKFLDFHCGMVYFDFWAFHQPL